MFDLPTLLEVSLSAAPVILLLLLLGPLLEQRYVPRWRYWAWLVVAVRLLIPINLSLPEPLVELAPPEFTAAPAAVHSAAPTPAAPVQSPSLPPSSRPILTPRPDATPSVPTPGETAPSLAQVLPRVWLAGALGVVLWNLVSWLRFRRWLRRWAVPEPSRAAAALAAELSPAAVRLLRCPGLSGPMMTGLFRPTVLLPDPPPGEEVLPFVLLHELTHFRRRDIWYKSLLLLTAAVHWFNPLVWLMLRAAEGDLERACDADVLRALPPEGREAYAAAILAAARRKPA